MKTESGASGAGAQFDLLTVGEVAAMLRISKTSVYRLKERRLVTFHKVGGGLRFQRSDLEEYLRRQRTGSADEWK
jgi:excisionase family DNA binding protein